MPLNLNVPQASDLQPRISVIGVGGAGGNAVNNMIDSNLEGVQFIVANTDAQAVSLSLAENKIQLGVDTTEGLGAGSQPQIGAEAAEESLPEVMDQVGDAHMLFITAGMGGGTGTGAAPVIARAAKEKGILTVGVVTKPFQFEGARRMRIAEAGIQEMQKYVDTLLIIPNQNLFRIADENTTFGEAFELADEVLHSGVRGITDLMIVPGLINLDFADVRSVMSEMGKAMMGTGEAEGEKRASEAALAAISNPLLDEVSMKGAKGVLINITGGMDMKLFEVDEAANRIRSEVDPDANIIVGSTFSNELDGKIRISVVATGIDVEEERPNIANQTRHATSVKPWMSSEQQTAPRQDTTDQGVYSSAEAKTVQQDMQMQHEQNPVGAYQNHIKKMLTDDEQEAPAKRNPYRRAAPTEAQKSENLSPLNAAMGMLKDTINSVTEPKKQEQVKPRTKAAIKDDDMFEGEEMDEMEIPKFLRNAPRR